MNDVRLLELRGVLASHEAKSFTRGANSREAAVALLLRPGKDLELLLIKRAEHERDPWSGHMALPGGRRDPGDADLIETALRETREEVGITVSREHAFMGALDEVGPRTPRLPPIVIAPFVFCVPAETEAQASPNEVDAAIWVPVDALRDESAADEILIELEGSSRAFPSLKVGEYVVWGLTHLILSQFLSLSSR